MKISEVIERLEEFKAEHGDLPVTVFDPDEMSEGDLTTVEARFSLQMDDDDKAISVTVVDPETQSAFS